MIAEDAELQMRIDDMQAGAARLDCPLGRENRGYHLLERMGWVMGMGLGKNGGGIVEPIPIVQADGFLGLGKASEYDRAAEDATEQRKALTMEVLLREEGDAAAQEARKAHNANEQRIQAALKEAHAEFYCECCHKQFKEAMEFSNHLSSYDHHHKKRFKEMQAGEAARKRAEREAKEARRAAKSQRIEAASLPPLPLPGAMAAALCADAAEAAQPGVAPPPPVGLSFSFEPSPVEVREAERSVPAPAVLGQGDAPLKFTVGMAGKKGPGMRMASKPRPAPGGFGAPDE